MPPRRKPSAAAGGATDQPPTLKLVMEKGPLAGQVNEFKPGSRIHIGRVARGNTLSVKDSGVSSKHLCIQAGSDRGRVGWTVTDLRSSNGTILNESELDPSEPAVVSDGDVIKIGEQTTIRVRLEGEENARRNPRRRGRNRGVGELGVIDEDSELGLGDRDLGGEKDEGSGNEGKLGGRRSKESENRGEEIESKKKGMGKGSLRDTTRGSRKEENLVIDVDGDAEKIDKGDVVEAEKGKNLSSKRITRSKNNESFSKDLDGDGGKNVGLSVAEGQKRVSLRRTTGSSRKEGNVGEIVIDLDAIEGKRNRRGRGRPKKTPLVETENQELNLEDKVCEEERKKSEAGINDFVERETVTKSASTSGGKEDEIGVGIAKVVPDLEMLTLGEWFKYLELFLPKQIVDETEEMISEMKQKAERLDEFALQQKNEKQKGRVDD